MSIVSVGEVQQRNTLLLPNQQHTATTNRSRKLKMYEIPPSVDRYLRISNRSMIHFPSDAFGNSLASSIVNGEEVTRLSPKKFLLSHDESSSIANGNYRDENPSRKRSCDRDENDFHKREKVLKGNEKESRLTDKCDVESVPAISPSMPVLARDISTNKCKEQCDQSKLTMTNGHGCYNRNVITRRFTEIKPKIASDQGCKVDEIAWQCSNDPRVATRKNPWGPQSYSELISAAIQASPGHKASLQQIYDWIVKNIPWFHDKADYPSTKGWKNAIRHTLSIRKRFTRIVNDRSPHASLWTLSKHGLQDAGKVLIKPTSH